jgi:hypothetical protein
MYRRSACVLLGFEQVWGLGNDMEDGKRASVVSCLTQNSEREATQFNDEQNVPSYPTLDPIRPLCPTHPSFTLSPSPLLLDSAVVTRLVRNVRRHLACE